MSDELAQSALSTAPVTPAPASTDASAGTSAANLDASNQDAKPAAGKEDLEALIEKAVEKGRKAAKDELESERRTLQSQNDKLIERTRRELLAQQEAMRQSFEEVLTQAVEPDKLEETRQQVNVRSRAKMYDAQVQQQNAEQARAEGERFVRDSLAKLSEDLGVTLSQEDFKDSWGIIPGAPPNPNGTDPREWLDKVARPLANAKLKDKMEKEISAKAKAELRAELKAQTEKAQTGATFMEAASGGTVRSQLAELDRLIQQGPPDDPRESQAYLKRLRTLGEEYDKQG